MNTALQSYTPLARPLNYDSLVLQEGCQVESGIKHYAAEGFDILCIQNHDPNPGLFSQSGLISFQVGPTALNSVEPSHNLIWTAWQGSAGIRFGIVGPVILPQDDKGALDTLIPAAQTTKLTHAFNKLGRMALAIEEPLSFGRFIRLSRFTDSSGTIATINFAGYQPLLYNTWNLDKGPAAQAGLVCYYLRAGHKSIYARFEQDDFGVEVEVLPDMRVELAGMLSIDSIAGKVRILGIDTLGRDATIRSAIYGQTLGVDNSTLALLLSSGGILEVAIQVTLEADKCTTGTILKSGSVTDVTADAPDLDPDNSTYDINLDSGEILAT